MNIYDFQAKTLGGKEVSLSQYRGKVVVIVNTASKCGLTPQYEGLEALYKKYKAQGLEILGFPCNQFLDQEPGTDDQVKEFCSLNYGVSFPMFSKVDVRGPQVHPLFSYLTAALPFKGLDPAKTLTPVIEKVLAEHYPEILKNNDIKWNFCKFVVSRDGTLKARVEPTTEPAEMEDLLKSLLAS